MRKSLARIGLLGLMALGLSVSIPTLTKAECRLGGGCCGSTFVTCYDSGDCGAGGGTCTFSLGGGFCTCQ